MIYRFRKILERPDWDIPVALSLEVAYDYHEGPINEDSEPISQIRWMIAAVRGPVGQYHQPSAFVWAMNLLYIETDLNAELLALCYEDYADRFPFSSRG